MPANMRKLMSEVPRPLEVEERDSRSFRDPSRKRLGRAEVTQRLEPLMNLVASGQIPMDDHTAKAVAAYLDGHDRHP